jgi:UDP-GlcNAc:undecaprenyl-phosphate GlcNAc-1-phosphate transferase
MLSPEESFLVALLLSLIGTWLTIKICRRKRWMFFPRADRWSQRTVAKFGGVAIVVTLVTVAQLRPISGTIQNILLLTLTMCILGLWDDIRPLPPIIKFSGQLLVATTAVYGGVLYPLSTHPFVDGVLTVLWIVGVTNAFNLLDNMDGLSAGVAAIAAFSLVFLVHSSTPIACIPLAGALLGFLVFNFAPAKIFMGDAGSLSIGFFLACVSVVAAGHVAETIAILLVPVLVVFLPIFDMLLVSITRRLNGKAISAGARDHSSHRLVLLGLTERKAVLILYSIALLSGAVAYLSSRTLPQIWPGLTALFILFSGLFWLYLAQMKLPDECLSRTNVATLALPEFLNSLSKRAALVVADMLMLWLALYLAFLLRFDGLNGNLGLFLLVGVTSIVIKSPLLALFGAYRQARNTYSFRMLYPLLKALALGSICLTAALTFMTRFAELSRAVLGMDFLISFFLLALVRTADFLFDDMLAKPNAGSRCVLVGDGSAEFFQHYFRWKNPNVAIAAITATSPIAPGRQLTAPIIAPTEMLGFLSRQRITDVFVLPDCPPEYQDFVGRMCSHLGVNVFKFEFRVTPLDEFGAVTRAVVSLGNVSSSTEAFRDN